MNRYQLLPLDNLIVLMEKSGSVAIDFDGNLYVSHTNGIVMVPGDQPGCDFQNMSNDELSAWIVRHIQPPK